MKKKLITVLLTALFMFGLLGITHATMIGDNVFANRIIPSISWEWGEQSITVVAGNSDKIALSSGDNLYVDFEATSILIDCGPGGGSGGPFPPSGHYLSFYGIDDFINSVSFTTNLIDFGAERIVFSDHGIDVYWGGIDYTGGKYLNLDLDLDSSTPVPEPATCLLLLCGIVGMAGIKKKVF